MKPEFVGEAFGEESVRLRRLPSEVRFRVHRLGVLNLPSGHVIACDPFIPSDSAPFVDSVPPGSYPVSVSIAAAGEERRVAFAKLEISNAAVQTWRPAEHDTDQVDFYGTESRLGYGVDSAMGCFMDKRLVQLLCDLYEKNPDYVEEFTDLAEANRADRWAWADLRPDPKSDLNMILFDSGWGDGFYSSYLGIDKAGTIACFVTDFEVLGEDHSEYWR